MYINELSVFSLQSLQPSSICEFFLKIFMMKIIPKWLKKWRANGIIHTCRKHECWNMITYCCYSLICNSLPLPLSLYLYLSLSLSLSPPPFSLLFSLSLSLSLSWHLMSAFIGMSNILPLEVTKELEPHDLIDSFSWGKMGSETYPPLSLSAALLKFL